MLLSALAVASTVLGQTPAEVTASPAAETSASTSPQRELERCQALFDAMDLEAALPPLEALLQRQDLSDEQMIQGYMLHASILATMGRTTEAESPFRLLLRVRADFEIGPEVSPVIASVYERIRAEEAAIRQQMEAIRLRELIASVRLEAVAVEEAEGGRPLELQYDLQDPKRAVATMTLYYRRAGDVQFAAQPFEPSAATGRWTAIVPPGATESVTGFVLEYYVTTGEALGKSLVGDGSKDVPLVINVAAGTVAEAVPIWERPLFWGLSAAAVLAVGAGSFLLIRDYRKLPDSEVEPVDF